MDIDLNQVKSLRKRSKGGWKYEIVAYLKDNQGSTDIECFNGTRADAADFSDKQKKNNIASQFTYLRDEGYVVVKDNQQCFLVTEPKTGKDNVFTVIKGQEAKVRSALNMPVEK